MSALDQRTLTIRVTAHEASRRELQQALLSWVTSARADRSVSQAHVSEDVLRPGTFGVEATMEDAADLEAHLRSPAFGALLGALTVLGGPVEVWIRQPAAAFAPDPLATIRRMRTPGDDRA